MDPIEILKKRLLYPREHPKELKPFVNEEVTIYSHNTKTFTGTLIELYTNYGVKRSNGKIFNLYIGNSVVIKTKYGQKINMRKIKL